MLELGVLFQILDEVLGEGLELVRHPPEDQRSAFGFGRANGILTAVESVRRRVEEAVEAQHQQEIAHEAFRDEET